ncbi:hypothetical protein K2173_027867 [Erythroxylum novogranatense]|uniref:FHA domain-containing protein n=1 Tax=Erythroxylum novogranatense TaxID=1862640 RepID=A0AAV8U0E5_9ROSI|nr:hypothetical protein K2173_027867 [Erythroxylum novogranatense]
MGALAPVSPWMPEDDLLLKNAVEAGASLESLAKGAVQFSRRYTVRELQERWHALLYDPVVSAEAAFHMIDCERSASSRLHKSVNTKENKNNSGKRKAENVRSCYYALRKRICNEPFNHMDLSFLVAPGNDDYMLNDNEPLSGDCILGDSVPNLGLQESDLDIVRCAFPQIEDGDTDHVFQSQFQNSASERFPMEQDNTCEEIPHMLGENLSHAGNQSVVEELCQQKELQANADPINECSKFDGDQDFNSSVPEYGSSFPDLAYSSPLPEMQMWTTVEGISEPSIPVDLGLSEKDLCAVDMVSLPVNGDTKNVYTLFHADSNLKLEITNEGLKDASTSAEGYLAELSNSLLNFATDDDLSFMDVDGKDVIDKTYYDGLSSLLLSSPNDVHLDQRRNITEQESSLTAECLRNRSDPCPGESEKNQGSCQSSEAVCNTQVQCLSAPAALNPQFPEMGDGVIYCVLNTEDPEIPNNDHVIFPDELRPKSNSIVARRSLQDAGKLNSYSGKEFLNSQRPSEVGSLSVQRDLQNSGQSQTCSQRIRSQVQPETVLFHPVGDHGIKQKLPSSESVHKIAGNTCVRSTMLKSAARTGASMHTKLEENTTETALTYVSVIKADMDAAATIGQQIPKAKVDYTHICAPEQVLTEPISSIEEPPMESDDEVPYFSDVEAMILDMDLDPEDQDIYSSEEVSRYQNEETKRAIIRLEQCAHSYMQRAIASHGAFAVLYGHHCKHYIKKPEVLIGRGTEDVTVDIDLGREGRANKISRRQAIINLDKSGCFHIKNLGKVSISMNDKEIAPGQSSILTPNCLIEIRGLAYIFETNQTCVKRYLDTVSQNHQDGKIKPEPVHKC